MNLNKRSVSTSYSIRVQDFVNDKKKIGKATATELIKCKRICKSRYDQSYDQIE